MTVALMCCGCFRMLGINGQAIAHADGFIAWKDVAGFPDEKTADDAAEKAGWQARDKKGPNHRCPECKLKPGAKRRGAYIAFGDTAAASQQADHASETLQAASIQQ